MISQTVALFRVKGDDLTLAVAQEAALSKQIPLMYFILLVNTWGVATTHMQVAPVLLTVVFPFSMTIICGIRIAQWWRRNFRSRSDPARAVRYLRQTSKVAWGLAAVFAGWGISLTPYGNNFLQSHVAFYMGVTVVGCIFCLTHLLPAALAVTFVVNVVFIAYFVWTGNSVFIAMAIDVGLVSSAMLIVLWVQYRDFNNLIVSRQELEAKKNALEKREEDLLVEREQTRTLSDENSRLANMDSLTSLANRRFFFSALDEMVRRFVDDQIPIYVGLLDLDGFKPVNDVHGHRVGDDLLVQLASRLKRLCEGRALIARLGGDEFAFMLQATDNDAARRLADEICVVCREPFIISGTSLEISASVGFASSELCADAYSHLYEQADFSLYQAKRLCPGTAMAFSNDHHVSLSRLTIMEQAFRDGSMSRDVFLEFQPIYDAELQRIIAFEALARWHHPSLGPISPSEFVPAAERLGYISQLTRLLLAKALQEARTWPRKIGLSFNLSGRDLSSSENAMRLLSLIAESGIQPARIELEITETAILTDLDRAQTIAAAFEQAGIGISLDDFGTGYSSLTHLHSMPLSKIKIDRSFVTGIDKKSASMKIVKSLIRMAADMDLECIIEGVETAAEMATIRDLGGRFFQGYHISRPLQAADARRLVTGSESYDYPIVQGQRTRL